MRYAVVMEKGGFTVTAYSIPIPIVASPQPARADATLSRCVAFAANYGDSASHPQFWQIALVSQLNLEAAASESPR
jgi:hypothetical protein